MDKPNISVEVVYALAERQKLLRLSVPVGETSQVGGSERGWHRLDVLCLEQSRGESLRAQPWHRLQRGVVRPPLADPVGKGTKGRGAQAQRGRLRCGFERGHSGSG